MNKRHNTFSSQSFSLQFQFQFHSFFHHIKALTVLVPVLIYGDDDLDLVQVASVLGEALPWMLFSSDLPSKSFGTGEVSRRVAENHEEESRELE